MASALADTFKAPVARLALPKFCPAKKFSAGSKVLLRLTASAPKSVVSGIPKPCMYKETSAQAGVLMKAAAMVSAPTDSRRGREGDAGRNMADL